MKLYVPIAKLDQQQRMVYGYASTEALDSQGEVVRKEALAAALPDYLRFANIREMHQPSAVGIAKEAAIDAKGLWIGAKIVADDAWLKVREGVYKGFSIGGVVTARDAGDPTVITGLDLAEISLVDRPANPEAVIEIFKAASIEGADALHKVGARHSRVDFARVQGIHDMAAALGAHCPGAEAEDAGDDDAAAAEKRAVAGPRMLADAFGKIAELESAKAALARRVAELERKPEPGKAVLRTVDKSADYPAAKSQDPTDTLSLIRRAYENARVIGLNR
ncbi:MAG TPA: XkdF-like putative serine protease domain-containing protein [Stellaceae bacterium]|nr:XkdF-like putative serine protease domain-containing protein [Stellaceae bacterium]